MNRFASSPAYLNGLPPTGQTTVYVVGDNGTNQTGIPHRYEVKNTGQYSGTVNIVLNGKTNVKSNAVVIDHQFKVMYSQTVSAIVGPSNNGLIPWTVNVNGEGVFEYVAAANAANMGGHNDWRIPQNNEMISIRNNVGANSVPDATAFPSFPASVVWTSTTAGNVATFAVEGNFVSGSLPAVLKTTTAFVLLVRSM